MRCFFSNILVRISSDNVFNQYHLYCKHESWYFDMQILALKFKATKQLQPVNHTSVKIYPNLVNCPYQNYHSNLSVKSNGMNLGSGNCAQQQLYHRFKHNFCIHKRHIQ